METVYKVLRVTRSNGKVTTRRSAMHYSQKVYRAAGISLRYKIRSINYPKVGKLFAFRTLREARNFAHQIRNSEVWKATTTSTERIDTILSDSFETFIPNLELFWGSLVIPLSIRRMPVPPGTLLCPSIKLVKCVYSD